MNRNEVLLSRIQLAATDAGKVEEALDKALMAKPEASTDAEECIRQIEANLAQAQYWATKLVNWGAK